MYSELLQKADWRKLRKSGETEIRKNQRAFHQNSKSFASPLVVTSLNLDAILAMRFTNPKKQKFVITNVITKLS